MTSRKLTARLRENDTIRHYYFLYGAEKYIENQG